MDETKGVNPKRDGDEAFEGDADISGSSSDEADGHHFQATLVITPSDVDHSEQDKDDTMEELQPQVLDIASTSTPDDDFLVTYDDRDDQPLVTEAAGTDKLSEAETTDNQAWQTEAETDKKPALTEADTRRQPSLSETEAETCRRRSPLTRQTEVLAGELETAHSLRRRSREDYDSSARPHEVVMEMDTFNRSSTRRDSFILAIEAEECREIDNSVDIRGSMSKAAIAESHSRTAQGLTTNSNLEGESIGSVSDAEEVEIFMEEESDPWEAISRCCEGDRKWVVCGTALLLLAVVSAIILIPQSIVYVEYYQMALARSRVTGRVDRGRTLYGGCYVLFPDTELVVFKSTAHHLHSQLGVSSADGLALGLQVSLQYFLKGEELGQLHVQYGEQYEAVVRSVVESEVKNSVVNFTLSQYRLHRKTLEHVIHRRLALRLQGDCCPRHCLKASQGSAAEANCTSSSCNTSPNCSLGLHMTLLPQHVQLGAIDIPEEVSERYMRFILLQAEAEKEKLLQEATVEKKRTELLVRDIKNGAHEVLEAARWTSKKILVEAEASAELKRQTAYNQALKHLMSTLNITAPDQRHSLLLLLAYQQAKDPVFFLSFDRLSLWG
ncbi:hypothetical protein ACOMHN_064636 [Nucella lapillus]